MLEAFVKKPVWAASLCLFLILFGIAAYMNLPVRQFPLLPSSKVTITTPFPGASPNVMEGFIAEPMQKALSGLPGLDYISSKNTQGNSVVTLKFFLGTDIYSVLPLISDRINALKWQLPVGTMDPQIVRVDPNAAGGSIMYIAGMSKKLSQEQITEYLNRVIIPRLEAVKGVGQVLLYGGSIYAMRIWLDPQKMAAHDVTASDVSNALKSNNLRSTSGTVRTNFLKFDVTTSTNLATADEFNHIVVKKNNNNYVYLKDIGRAELTTSNTDTSAYANGEKTVMMGVVAKDKANSIATANRVNQLLKTIKLQLPPAMEVNLIWDVTQFSRASIKEVRITILEAVALVFLVIFAFLGSIRAILVPLVTIPISLLGASAIMFALGYSLNTLTLLSWVLAIGLVVDDAIVVVENIHRHIHLGESRIKAAIKGVQEIRDPIITITLAVAVVFLPIGFVPGISGALFKQFATTISIVVLLSGLLALFVSPTMCAKLLPAANANNKLADKIDTVFEKVKLGYRHILTQVIHMPWLIAFLFLFLMAAGTVFYKNISSELMPIENENVIVAMGIGPSDANLNYLEKYSSAINKIFKNLPEKKAYGLFNGISLVGASNSVGWVLLTDSDKRTRGENEILEDVQLKMEKVPGVFAFAFKRPTTPGALLTQPLEFIVKTTRDYKDLFLQFNKLMAAARKYPGLQNITTTFRFDRTELYIDIDRSKIDALGIPTKEVSDALGIMLGKPIINRFGAEGYSYEVIPQMFLNEQSNLQNINNIYVRTASGQLVNLANIVTIQEQVVPQSLNQFQQLRSASLNANVTPGYTMGQALNFLQNYVTTNMPHQYAYDYKNQARQFIQSKGVLVYAFGFALILIYLLLTMHFNSFRDPFVIMLSVPLAIVGALYFMYLSDSTLNIYSKIGLIMLVGLISKHGVLMIDFANRLQETGENIHDAIIDAACIRLRPILMTTAAIVFGAIPLVLASGAGAIAREQIGWVIIGGMSLGTCLTLFVVPVAYNFFATRIPKS